MQGIERPLRQITTLAAHEVRTNLLFTMSNRTGGEHDARRKLLLRMTFSHHLHSTPPRDPQDRREPRQSSQIARSPNRNVAAGSDNPADCASGGAGRDRTDDILLAKQALSQLSYGP